MPSEPKFDTVYVNARRETVFVLIVWIVFCVWVVGYCLSAGYNIDPENLNTVLGMPAWIFWGVGLPWVMANVVAIYFGLKFMADDPLEDPPVEQRTGKKEDSTEEESKNG
tara:strand:+ start:304 stop:633 length:330 start_codon:yes stop_codon:yes gene_type:complete